MGLIYEKKKDENNDAIDFMEVVEAQRATQNITVGETVSPLPYDAELKSHINRTVEQEQRPKDCDK